MVSRISLASLQTGGVPKPPIMGLYGVSGIGKSSTAACFPAPIFIQCEDGLTSPTLKHVQTLGVMQNYEDVLDAMAVIYEHAAAKGWKTIVVDTLSKLDPMIEDYISRTQFGGAKLADVPFGKGYGPYISCWREWVEGIKAFRNHLGMNVVLLDHVRVTRVNPPDADSYNKYGLAVSEKVAPMIISDLDALLFANYPLTNLAAADSGFGKKISRAVIDKPRLYCQQRGSHDAKNRYQFPENGVMSFDFIAQYIPTIAGLPKNSAVEAAE